MPYTPLHLIPGLIIYLLLFPYVDLLALMAATIFLDVEPFVNLFILRTLPLHGVLHSLFGALLVGAPTLILICRLLETKSRGMAQIFKVLDWNPTIRSTPSRATILSVYLGIATHLILDFGMHRDIPVFYPLDLGNPFQSEFFTYWSHIIVYTSGLVLTPLAYVVGRRLHGERPFTHFP